jgi:hypothetical protein
MSAFKYFGFYEDPPQFFKKIKIFLILEDRVEH